MPNDIQPPPQEVLPPAIRRAELVAGAEIAPIVPRTVEEAFRMATAIVKAGLAPDSYDDDPQKILIGIMKSCEVGLPPITGLSTIAIIRKRPCIWGDGAVALVQRTGLVEKIEQRYEDAEGGTNAPALTDFPDTFAAVYRIWRKGQDEPFEGRFSVREAKRAHLWGNTKKAPWIEYPRRMLMARARAYALREGFADALAGLAIREEVEDLPPEPPAKTDASFLDDTPALAPPTEQPMPGVTIEPDQPREAATTREDNQNGTSRVDVRVPEADHRAAEHDGRGARGVQGVRQHDRALDTGGAGQDVPDAPASLVRDVGEHRDHPAPGRLAPTIAGATNEEPPPVAQPDALRGEQPVVASRSLIVPIAKPVGKPADWLTTASTMIHVINEMSAADVSEFRRVNDQALGLMRGAHREQYQRVQSALRELEGKENGRSRH